MAQTEAFARTLIDAQLDDQGWRISEGISVRYEYTLPDGDRADYLPCGREGRGLAIVEAKRESINAFEAREQGRHNAEQAGAPASKRGPTPFTWLTDVPDCTPAGGSESPL